MKKSLFILLAFTGLMLGSSVFAETKIGVVDFAKVLPDSPQLAAAKSELKKQFDPREKELIDAQKKFQEAIETFSKNSPTMKADVKEAEQRKIVEQQKKLQDMQEKLQKDVSEVQGKLMNELTKKIQTAIDKVAVDKKLDLILIKAATPFSKKELEVTDEVAKQLKGEKSDKKSDEKAEKKG